MTDTYKERATMAETIIATSELESLKLTSWTDLENYGEEFCKAFNAGVSACIAARPAPGWRPIESAPKDGTNLLLGFPRSHSGEGFWMGDADRNHWGEVGWFECSDDILCDHPSHPTQWMPLPPPPSTPKQGEGE